MGKAPFTMKGFSYPGKSPIQLDLWKGALSGTQNLSAGSADQLPTGSSSSGSSGIDIGQITSGAMLGFGGGGGGGGTWGATKAAGAIGKYFMGGIGSGLFGGLFGKRGQRRQSKATRGKRGYELSADSWEDTKPGYVSGATSFMNS